MIDANRPDIEELVSGFRRELAELEAKFMHEIGGLRAENLALKSQNAGLHLTIKDLRRRLAKNSSNSSKPPSSDGLSKPPRVAGSLRGKSGKASGGQAGHKGDTLRQAAVPDHVERHEADTCGHCHAALSPAMMTGLCKRQVLDMPQPRLEVREHQAFMYRCAACRGETQAAFPAGVTHAAQYGARIKAAAVYLNVQQLIPEDRVVQAMNDLLGAEHLCAASIMAWGKKKAQELAPVSAHIASLVAAAPVRHLDETGFVSGAGRSGCIAPQPRR